MHWARNLHIHQTLLIYYILYFQYSEDFNRGVCSNNIYLIYITFYSLKYGLNLDLMAVDSILDLWSDKKRTFNKMSTNGNKNVKKNLAFFQMSIFLLRKCMQMNAYLIR